MHTLRTIALILLASCAALDPTSGAESDDTDDGGSGSGMGSGSGSSGNMPPAITTFTATPHSPYLGTTAQVSWMASNADSCTLVKRVGPTEFMHRELGAAGVTQIETGAPREYTLQLECKNAGSYQREKRELAFVVKSPDFVAALTATPSSVALGDDVQFDWLAAGADACTYNVGDDPATPTVANQDTPFTQGPHVIQATARGVFRLNMACFRVVDEVRYYSAANHVYISVY